MPENKSRLKFIKKSPGQWECIRESENVKNNEYKTENNENPKAKKKKQSPELNK